MALMAPSFGTIITGSNTQPGYTASFKAAKAALKKFSFTDFTHTNQLSGPFEIFQKTAKGLDPVQKLAFIDALIHKFTKTKVITNNKVHETANNIATWYETHFAVSLKIGDVAKLASRITQVRSKDEKGFFKLSSTEGETLIKCKKLFEEIQALHQEHAANIQTKYQNFLDVILVDFGTDTEKATRSYNELFNEDEFKSSIQEPLFAKARELLSTAGNIEIKSIKSIVKETQALLETSPREEFKSVDVLVLLMDAISLKKPLAIPVIISHLKTKDGLKDVETILKSLGSTDTDLDSDEKIIQKIQELMTSNDSLQPLKSLHTRCYPDS